jgi:hypothetical protein
MKNNSKNFRATDNHISEVMEGRSNNTIQRGGIKKTARNGLIAASLSANFDLNSKAHYGNATRIRL